MQHYVIHTLCSATQVYEKNQLSASLLRPTLFSRQATKIDSLNWVHNVIFLCMETWTSLRSVLKGNFRPWLQTGAQFKVTDASQCEEGEARVFVTGQTELSGQSCMSTDPGLGVEGLGSKSCLQLVNICQSKYSTCEISRTVKTNRVAGCGGGEGWEMYTLMSRCTQKHTEEERRKKSAQEREESKLYTCAHSHIHCKRLNDITTCLTHVWRKWIVYRYMLCLHQCVSYINHHCIRAFLVFLQMI